MAKFKFKGLDKLLSKLNPKPNAKPERSKPGTQSKSKQNLGSKPEFDSNAKPLSHRLDRAAQRGDLPTVRALWAESKDDKGHEERTLSAFMTAVNGGQTDVLLLFLQEFGVDPNMSNEGEDSALTRAIHLGDGKTVRILIENGADPFIGKLSPFELARLLWTPKAFGLLEDLIKKSHPELEKVNLEKVNNARDRGEENQKKTRDMHTTNQLWPDREFVHRGTGTYLSPSDPAYWH